MCANIQSALLESKEHNESNKVKSRIVNDSIVLIQERTALPITAQDIAECLEISREHLTRIFKDQLGVTPYRFIVNMKMEKAKHELIQSDTPIKEIAYDLGFSSPELFTQVFKREYKLTPKQFRATYSI
jgi:AraC-like DNA-binding protein